MSREKRREGPAYRNLREGIAYLIFGVLTTVIDYIISNALFYLAHMPSVKAQTIAWVAAVLFAFVTNKWWVFESHTLAPKEVWREFVSFIVCRIVTFLFNLAAIFVMVDMMKMEFFVCKLIVSVVVIVLNYVFSKILIFTKKKEK
ncbi:MAG: GtrA family protein [Lachnospiraceae bacterium]|nr:GtrA family protein [Lachnospiraceae bacterium]